MQSDLEIKKFMAEELEKGLSLSEVQKSVNEKFNLKMTFMDIRILASELENIDWGKNDPKVEEKKEEEAKKPAEPTGSTTVEISKVVRPGAIAEGKVYFGSGATADWIYDQSGQLGLDKVVGKPTETDIQEFQVELQKAFSK